MAKLLKVSLPVNWLKVSLKVNRQGEPAMVNWLGEPVEEPLKEPAEANPLKAKPLYGAGCRRTRRS